MQKACKIYHLNGVDDSNAGGPVRQIECSASSIVPPLCFARFNF